MKEGGIYAIKTSQCDLQQDQNRKKVAKNLSGPNRQRKTCKKITELQKKKKISI